MKIPQPPSSHASAAKRPSSRRDFSRCQHFLLPLFKVQIVFQKIIRNRAYQRQRRVSQCCQSIISYRQVQPSQSEGPGSTEVTKIFKPGSHQKYQIDLRIKQNDPKMSNRKAMRGFYLCAQTEFITQTTKELARRLSSTDNRKKKNPKLK